MCLAARASALVGVLVFCLNVLRDFRQGLNDLGAESNILYGKPENVFSDQSAQYGVFEVNRFRDPVSSEWADVERTKNVCLLCWKRRAVR